VQPGADQYQQLVDSPPGRDTDNAGRIKQRIPTGFVKKEDLRNLLLAMEDDEDEDDEEYDEDDGGRERSGSRASTGSATSAKSCISVAATFTQKDVQEAMRASTEAAAKGGRRGVVTFEVATANARRGRRRLPTGYVPREVVEQAMEELQAEGYDPSMPGGEKRITLHVTLGDADDEGAGARGAIAPVPPSEQAPKKVPSDRRVAFDENPVQVADDGEGPKVTALQDAPKRLAKRRRPTGALTKEMKQDIMAMLEEEEEVERGQPVGFLRCCT